MLHAPLDLTTVHALDAPATTHPSLQASVLAWLTAYDLAQVFGFAETTAIRPAAAAWDRAVEALRCVRGDEPRFGLTASRRRAIRPVHA